MSDVDKKNQFKVVIIGEASVGKSCLRQRFENPEVALPRDYDPTVGVEFTQKFINDTELSIVDIAGDWQFQSITRNYLPEAHGVLLVFDPTNRTSFEEISRHFKNTKKSVAEDTVFILVSTKSDLASERVVTSEEAQQFADAHGMSYVETSAKDNKNVNEVFKTLSQKMILNAAAASAKVMKAAETAKMAEAARVAEQNANESQAIEAASKIIAKLNAYIKRIESHKNSDDKINFRYGFWFRAEKRALNREINYHLARELKKDLMTDFDICADSVNSSGSVVSASSDNSLGHASTSSSASIVSLFGKSAIKNLRYKQVKDFGKNKQSDSGIYSRELNKVIRFARSVE